MNSILSAKAPDEVAGVENFFELMSFLALMARHLLSYDLRVLLAHSFRLFLIMIKAYLCVLNRPFNEPSTPHLSYRLWWKS